MADKRRVVVTGLGCVSPLGLSVDSLWQGFMECKSGIDKITRFDTEHFATNIAGEVRDFDPLNYISKQRPYNGQ